MTSAITAVDAVGQLGEIAAGFLAVTGTARLATGLGGEQLGDSPMLMQLNKAQKAAAVRAAATYKTDFAAEVPAMQVDDGVVLNYASDPGDGMVQIIDQLKVQFTNWNLIISDADAQQLAKTMATEVNAQLGAVGSTGGSYAIDANTMCQWTLAYGLFTQDDAGHQALVYGFAADEPAA